MGQQHLAMHLTIGNSSRRATTRLDVELFDGDGARLAHAEGAADSLVFQGGVHGRLQDEHMVGRRQVDAHRTAAHAQQEHRCRRIPLERVNRLQQRFHMRLSRVQLLSNRLFEFHVKRICPRPAA